MQIIKVLRKNKMSNRVSRKESEEVAQRILESIDDIKNSVPSILKKSFYFKSRKSVEIAERIIRTLSEEDAHILDPFLGGGSFLIASLDADRYIEGIELDNYTFFALEMQFSNYDYEIFINYLNAIKENIKDKILYLYRTKCCDIDNYISKLFFDPENSEYFNPIENRDTKGGNIHLLEKCPSCGKTRKSFDEYDSKVLKESERLDVKNFPQARMLENSRINITATTGADRYANRFTPRNQYALLQIQKEISNLPQSIEKNMLQHILVTILARAKVVMYGSGTDNLYHIIVNQAQDENVWSLFENKCKDFIKFKKEYKDYLVDNVTNNNKFSIKQGDYYSHLKNIREKYDLIFSDFPYTDQVPYLERNQLFRIWLETFMDKQRFKLNAEMLDQEIVVTNAVTRPNKSSHKNYYNDLDKMFATLSQVLKTEAYAVFVIKLGEEKYFQVYAEIINLAKKNGLEFITRIGLEKNDPTLRKQSAYKRTLMKEQVVVFKKIDLEESYLFIGNENYEDKVIEWTYNEIKEGQSKNLTQAVTLVKNNITLAGHISTASDLEKIKNIIEKNFVVENSMVYMNADKLYLSVEDNETLFMKLYNFLPIYIKALLDEQGSFVLEDLYLKLTSILCESDNATVMQILEDERHASQIENILNVYCDVVNEHYVIKQVINEIHEGKKDISVMTGTEFELLIEKILIKEGFFNTVVKGGAGDRGVDITASKMENNLDKGVYFIQCKRWTANVGSQPMQRLFSEREYHKAQGAICVTSSDFTSEGIAVANQHNIQMWDGRKVLSLLNKYFPDQYYNAWLIGK